MYAARNEGRASERGGRDPGWPNTHHTTRRGGGRRRGPPPIAAGGAGRCMYHVEYKGARWKGSWNFWPSSPGPLPRLTGRGCFLSLVACPASPCDLLLVASASALLARLPPILRVACVPAFVAASPRRFQGRGAGGVVNPVQILDEEIRRGCAAYCVTHIPVPLARTACRRASSVRSPASPVC